MPESAESDELIVKHGCLGQEEETPFVPETFYHNFGTCWSQLATVLEVWGFTVNRCTYRESVANLALASKLRYTGSMSLSYPRQRIDEIIEQKEGYNVQTSKGLEPLPQGWELRALKEFQKLARWHEIHAFFIMVCKLALQMNLQITFIIIFRIKHNQLSLELDDILQTDTLSMTLVGFASITSLLLTFTLELLDVKAMIEIFWHVRGNVKEAVFEHGSSSKAFALDDFIVDEDDSIQRIILSGKDLKAEYYISVRHVWRLVGITIFSTWLVFYALLKFFCAVRCEHGAWDWESSCLPDPNMSSAANRTDSCFYFF